MATEATGGGLEFKPMEQFEVKALFLEDGVVPPTINYRTPDPECDLDYTPNEAVECELTWALSTNLGFGGHNAALALRAVERS